MIAIDGIPPSMYGGAGGGDRALQGRTVPFGGGASAAAAPVAGGSGYSNAVPSASSMAGPSSSGKSIAGWGQMFKNSREYTVLKKVVRILQDNRLNSGDEETAQRLQDLNRSQTESYPILKTILNVIFITTGVVLLIAVVVVIIYTSLGKHNMTDSKHKKESRTRPCYYLLNFLWITSISCNSQFNLLVLILCFYCYVM